MLKLNHPLLNIQSLIESFKASVIDKTEPNAPAPSLLTQFRIKLKNIYFPWVEVDKITAELIQQDNRFQSNYSELKAALQIIFTLNDKIKITEALETQIFSRIEDKTQHLLHWTSINQELEYFENNDRLIILFGQLATQCRAMSALIEDNLVDERMPYLYAYRLMALFYNQTPLPNLNDIANHTFNLLKQAPQNGKPYHDVILNQIQLSNRKHVHDLSGWTQWINSKKGGISALKYFAMAPEIEAQIYQEKGVYQVPHSLSEAEAMAARCFYKRAQEHLELAELCRNYNIPEEGDECSFNKCLDYLNSIRWPAKEIDFLPMTEIIGIGEAEGYCWVKLPSHDLRALILGRMTACCQSIGGHGHQCVKDAVTLSHNGLYVLLKRRDQATYHSKPTLNGEINDGDYEIIGQSYAWISQTGNITLDSLESSKGRVSDRVAQTLLIQFATKVLELHPHIKRVTLGLGGGTSKNIGFPRANVPEKMHTGTQYSDSFQQYQIANRVSSWEYDQFEAILNSCGITDPHFKDCLHYLSEYLTNTSNLDTQLTTLIKQYPKIIQRFNHEALFRLIALNPSPTLDDLYPVNFNALDQLSEEERTAALAHISTARLGWQEATPEYLLKIAAYIPQEEHFKILKAHKNILQKAAKSTDVFKSLLAIYPETQRLDAIKAKDLDKKTVLHYIADNPESLQAVFDLTPQTKHNELIEIIQEKSHFRENVFHYAARNPESLKILIQIYPETKRNQLIETIQEKSSFGGQSVLHIAAHHPESLKTLIQIYPEAKYGDLIHTIQEKRNEESILEIAAHHSESFQVLFEVYSKTEKLTALKEINKSIKCFLHLIAHNPKLIKSVLQIYPIGERLTEIQKRDINDKTVLHYIANNSDSLKVILEMCPEEERITAINAKDRYGETLLHYIVSDAESLKKILTLCPISDRLVAINKKDRYGCTVLRLALKFPESLKTILELCSKTDLLTIIKGKDNDQKTILHWTVDHPKSLSVILNMCPETELLTLIREKDEDEKTVLHWAAANNLESLKILLQMCPEEERLNLILEKNIYGTTVLYLAAASPHSFKVILDVLPKTVLNQLSQEILNLQTVQTAIAQFKNETHVSISSIGLFNQGHQKALSKEDIQVNDNPQLGG